MFCCFGTAKQQLLLAPTTNEGAARVAVPWPLCQLQAGVADADGSRGPPASTVPAKTRVVRLLTKHVYEHYALKYIGATGAHGGGSSPRPGGAYPTEDECTELAATFRMWCRMPSHWNMDSAWYLPTYELFLDCGRMLCDHMCLYGLGQLLSTGAGGDTTHRGPILDAFWKFDDVRILRLSTSTRDYSDSALSHFWVPVRQCALRSLSARIRRLCLTTGPPLSSIVAVFDLPRLFSACPPRVRRRRSSTTCSAA